MANSQALVAGIPVIMMRIGFVGETGWEMHFPAEYGEYMWEALLEAGKEFGVTPFGVETQRTLRLEKGHVIIGQDTDMLTNPLGANMSWVVKLDKEDFVGKAGLLLIQQREESQRLVGFLMEGEAVPQDGDAVIHDGRPLGRVTSARFSPTLGRGFGMAWVPPALAREGQKIQIAVDGRLTVAKVVAGPFYDPEGKRLRE